MLSSLKENDAFDIDWASYPDNASLSDGRTRQERPTNGKRRDPLSNGHLTR